MARQRSIFDIVGPVMIGPSSSHTAGAVRLGALAAAGFGRPVARARVLLHGSFASTGRGHGTDVALVAGLLGMAPDDDRIPDALTIARGQGVEVEFVSADLGETHPNTAELHLTDADGAQMVVRGASLGGGDVVITRLDGFEVELSGELPALVVEHIDRPGEIAAVTAILGSAGVNIARMQVSREQRGARAIMLIETDAVVDDATVEAIEAEPAVTSVRRLAAV